VVLSVLLACATGEVATVEAAQATAEAPPGVDCRTSCSLGDAQDDLHLSEGEIEVLLEDWNTQTLGDATIELETLLFYFQDTQTYLDTHDAPLDAAHLAFLRHELGRDQVTIEMRLLDDAGDVRGTLAASDIPLKQKQHIRFEGTGSLGHLETGGKVKRVGLGHLWSRW